MKTEFELELEGGTEDKTWCCPECHGENYEGIAGDDTARMCNDCGREWFTDIDYEN